jgi:hypothetical protein
MTVSPKELTAFRIDPPLLESLRVVKARDGIRISEQVRQAIVEWLERRHAEPGELHRAFDFFENSMAAVSNRGGELDGLPLPKEFGPRLSGRPFGSLTESDMEVLDNFAKALGRRTKAHRDFWKQATLLAHARARRRDMELQSMTDDEVRRELFAALVARLRDERRKDGSLSIVERVPILALDRDGHTADIDQGNGQRMLQGTMIWRKGEDADARFKFSVVRSPDKKRLEMKPGAEGGFDEVVNHIVTMFVRHSR